MSEYNYKVQGAVNSCDPQYVKKVNAYWACVDAGVEVPLEVTKYFDYEVPPRDGNKYTTLGAAQGVTWWETASYDKGFEVDLDKLPKKYRKLKFKISW